MWDLAEADLRTRARVRSSHAVPFRRVSRDRCLASKFRIHPVQLQIQEATLIARPRWRRLGKGTLHSRPRRHSRPRGGSRRVPAAAQRQSKETGAQGDGRSKNGKVGQSGAVLVRVCDF